MHKHPHFGQHGVRASHEYVLGLRHIFAFAVASAKTSLTPKTINDIARPDFRIARPSVGGRRKGKKLI